ncbi:hypothetical protein HK098_002806 [Nowakowskiella sp. JEL0407]|nr:hypothetical protein HK098_002806 [Nowakowskiella sp. JEL0407]
MDTVLIPDEISLLIHLEENSVTPTVFEKGFQLTLMNFKYDIMLSYARHGKDEIAVTQIKTALQQRGVTVWFRVDENYTHLESTVTEAIDSSGAFVCCLSKEYENSIDAMQEFRHASAQNKRIIAIRLEQGKRSPAIEFVVGPSFWLLYENNNETQLEKLENYIVKEISQFKTEDKVGYSDGDRLLEPIDVEPTIPDRKIQNSYLRVISLNDIDFSDSAYCIGRGEWGSVFLVKLDMLETAVFKKLHGTLSKRAKQELVKEAQIMARINHPRLVRFYGIVDDFETATMGIVMEYVPNGSLFDIINNDESDPLPLERRFMLLFDVAIGMVTLHRQDIIHNNLKPQNILVDENWRAKICDFGLAVVKREITSEIPQSADVRVGMRVYMAPELFEFNSKSSKASDVFAFAVIMSEMMTWSGPFGLELSEFNPDHIYQMVIREQKRPTLEFPEDCWDHNPANRPSFSIISSKLTEFTKVIRKDALLKMRTLPIRRIKLVTLGQGRAGKTSLLRALRGVGFSVSQESTVYVEAMEVMQQEVTVSEKWEDVETSLSQLEISMRSTKFVPTPYKKASSRRNRKREVTSQKKQLNIVAEEHARRITDDDIGKIIIEHEALQITNVEKDSTITIKVYDFAGQSRYSAFQHLFVTRQAVYVVAFRLKEMFPAGETIVDPEERSVVLGWLSAINARSPESRIFLVGTGYDEKWSDERWGYGIMKFENSIPIAFLNQLIPTKNPRYSRFTHITSAKTNEGVEDLRRLINESVLSTILQEAEKPIDWILFQDEIVKMINEKKDLLSVSFDFLRNLGEKFRITSAVELSELLKYWHEIGVILYYPDNPRLKETVFLNPQSIINAVALLFEMNDDPFQIQTDRLKEVWELTKRKVWKMSLMLDVLEEVVRDDLESFIEVLKEFDLICILSENSLDMEESLAILPFLLNNTSILTHDLLSRKPGFENIDFGMSFPKTYLPPGLFHQLAVRFASSSKYHPTLFQRNALVFVEEALLIIREKMECGLIHFSLFVRTAQVRSDFANAWSFICNTIDDVFYGHWSKDSEYNLSLICDNQNEEIHVIPKLPSFKSVPAPIVCDHACHLSTHVAHWVCIEPLKRYWFQNITSSTDFYHSAEHIVHSDEGREMIMLSYSWGKVNEQGEYHTQELVKRIKIGLEQRGFRVWMDTTDMRRDMTNKMTTVITNCLAVIACVTNDYHINNTNANDEFRFAYNNKKLIFGAKMTPETNMKIGAYGLRMGDSLYYDFAGCGEDEIQWNRKLDELVDHLKSELKILGSGK